MDESRFRNSLVFIQFEDREAILVFFVQWGE